MVGIAWIGPNNDPTSYSPDKQMLPQKRFPIQPRNIALKTRVITIISVGITIGFLLGMGVSSLLRAAQGGGDKGLEVTFTALVAVMVGVLITYVAKTVQ